MTEAGFATGGCPFCEPDIAKVFYEDPLIRCIWDGFPVSAGHALLVPRRHVASWFDTTPPERLALIEAIDRAKAEIERARSPDGYNIGVNVGAAAGQTVFHLHVHVIPRYRGDVPDPRGGVRHVIPGKARYWDAVRDASSGYEPAAAPLLTIGGSDSSLLKQLKLRLATAKSVDVAVAFVMPSGLELLYPSLEEALCRGTRIRVLTGDYLDATDPTALLLLLDLRSDRGKIERRVYRTQSAREFSWPDSFHPKAYIVHDRDGEGHAFVGSSNLSRTALVDGIEWNYRVVFSRDRSGFAEICASFEELFLHPATTELTHEWVESYRARRRPSVRTPGGDSVIAPQDETLSIPEPHPIQKSALDALNRSRESGDVAGLVVLATGLGKTWLSAFDSRRFKRVLFVAHREEILSQAMHTFQRIRPQDHLGYYTGTEKNEHAAVLFASIQTLGRQPHLNRFPADHFDYIVVDEFHHASAATYRRLLRHFRPTYLLGLTATPERSDGADLLDLCGGNLIFRCDLGEGIRRGLLAPFDYYGVPDEVDYANIPWRSNRFSEEELTSAVSTLARAENALEQLEKRGGRRVLAFCVSQRHADFMAEFLRSRGKHAVAVHSGPSSAPRVPSLEQLQAGDLDVVCAVDMFNEGVDLPDLDTVLMLRPTESKVLWLQQFGRGLRKADKPKRLSVIDYIGNHRSFLLKPQTLFNLPAGDEHVLALLEQCRTGTAELPPGCSVTYDLETVDILRGLLRVGAQPADALRTYVQDFISQHGVRPTALEAYRDGYAPRSVRRQHGSWFAFLESLSALDAHEARVSIQCRAFLDTLQDTQMTKSYKMVTLLAMLNADRFPGKIGLDELTVGVRQLGMHRSEIAADFGEHFENDVRLARALEDNPIDAWVGGAGTGAQRFFDYDAKIFVSKVGARDEDRAALQELTRELTEWRLAEYLDRPSLQPTDGYVVKVNQSNGNPILMPLDRDQQPGLPEGLTPFEADGSRYIGNFVKIALNIARKEGSDRNELPSILRKWFGPDAGAPGTRHQVRLIHDHDKWRLEPIGVGANVPVLWKAYSREQIPGLFGLPFESSLWRQGFVRRDNRLFLLVTLDKSSAADEHKYDDKFLSANELRWQSQNRTAQGSGAGIAIREHRERGIEVHLFVRRQSKTNAGKAAPFIYCGTVDFVRWEGDRPITVTWRLSREVPERLRADLDAS